MTAKFYSVDGDSFTSKPIYDEEELSNAVLETIKYYKERYEKVAEENKRLLLKGKEAASEELKGEIKYLKHRLALSYGSFASQKEKEAYANFQERHMHDRLTSRANGGKCPYLIPNSVGIGTILHVKCPICGEEEDITDDSVW
jgi:hypothetical protein